MCTLHAIRRAKGEILYRTRPNSRKRTKLPNSHHVRRRGGAHDTPAATRHVRLRRDYTVDGRGCKSDVFSFRASQTERPGLRQARRWELEEASFDRPPGAAKIYSRLTAGN